MGISSGSFSRNSATIAEQLETVVIFCYSESHERDLGGFFCVRACYTYAMIRDDDEEVSSTDQYIYDEYSGLDVYGTETDSDECEMPESMNDI